MNGPQHYREAQRLAALAKKNSESSDALVMAQLATAHALLANAAANVEAAGITAAAHDVRSKSLNGWFDTVDPQEASS